MTSLRPSGFRLISCSDFLESVWAGMKKLSRKNKTGFFEMRIKNFKSGIKR